MSISSRQYQLDRSFSINVGFTVTGTNIETALKATNKMLRSLPDNLFTSIDFKTTSAMIGAIFCKTIAEETGGIVNPIEKGHPDVIPTYGMNASEEELKKFPEGLEIKCTIGNIKTGANLRAGSQRLSNLTGITWQAHHREVTELLGLVWDFVEDSSQPFNFPCITGAFFSNSLTENDWGEISGTTGRNTKVTGMKRSGKKKMGQGRVCLIDDKDYRAVYRRLLD